MGENLIVTNEHRNLANEFATIENDLKMDPIGNMGNIEAGQRILNDPQTKDSFLNDLHKRVVGYNNMSDEMKKKLDDGTLQTIHQHLGALGKMFESMKTYTVSKQDPLNSVNPT